MRNYLLSLLTLLAVGQVAGQVRGVSYTIAPSVSYNWFGDDSGLDDAFMFGGRLGFGFGEYVELRATYLQTIDQQTNIAGLNINVDSTFANQGVDLSRYGAELKLNIGRGTLLPYLVLGGGIQDTKREGLDKAENIFGTLGLGLTLSAADRYAFGVEGKYITYSGNSVRNLFSDVDEVINNQNFDNFNNENIGTFAVAANLQFYLGGRRPGQLSEIDQKYLENFQGGISGLSLPIELGLAQVNWDETLPYRDAYFAGGTAGFAFGPLISLRGFYYRGMKDDEINFDFDDISLYGADFRFNLSQASSGIVPYLNLGGGYIDLSDGYNDGVTEVQDLASSQGFASGGGGIYLKFGERVKLNGGVRALLTSGSNLEDLNSKDQITTSYMYNAGLGFVLGGNNRKNPDVVRQSTLEDRLAVQQRDFERRADSIRTANQLEIAELRQRYQDSIASLDQELIDALDAGDVETAAVIKAERENAVAVVEELDTRQNQLTNEGLQADVQRQQLERAEVDAALGRQVQPIQRATAPQRYNQDGSVIILQSAQIDKLIEAIGQRNAQPQAQQQMQPATSGNDQLDQINRRIERMENMMFEMNNSPRMGRRGVARFDDGDRIEEDRRIIIEREFDNRNDSRTDGRVQQDSSRRPDVTQMRIDNLERQLRESRESGNNTNDRMEYSGDSEERIRQLEERMMERIDNIRNNTNDTESQELRNEMMRDMTDYQSEMMQEIRSLQNDLDRANRELARREAQQDAIDERIDLERDQLRQERRAARQAASTYTAVDSAGNKVIVPGTRKLEDITVNTGGVYLADENTEGFFSNFTYTGMSGTAGFNFGDATGLGLGLRWHYKLGPDQRAEFMPEAYFGIGSPTTFGIFGNIVYPIITDEAKTEGLIPYAGIGIGAMQIKDDENTDELNFRPAINLLLGTYLPVGGGRVFVDFSTRNFFSVNQLTGGYRFNF
ncbi:hypothetical protein GGR28_003105 [Lewinella aquimaris]|uniref:Outer membrane protein beta-barrel domain-containing protein n=1 Tax=Neolewinella aquimaris TaxID=1835722 RepID=A0A840E5L0_9BACT|nr:hypothetical protein [Neolewinella aquimaris]MBB4080471.1 hypothetical protein [Neolewinella aquimaris]